MSDPLNALQQTVRFRNGSETSEGHGTFFEVYDLPKPPPGFKVANAVTETLFPADGTYTLEVRFTRSWTAPGICNEWFPIGTYTLRLKH